MLPCAILCGGLATRLRPITTKVPKSLIPIDGTPFIAHQLKLLRSKGVQQVVLCTGYLGEMIEDFAKDGAEFGMQVNYSPDGAQLLGTAGAIRKALPLLGDRFFVVYGDSYLPCDYGAIAAAFIKSGLTGLMTIYRNDGLWDASNVEAAVGTIVRYDKRNRTAAMRHIDYGLGVFSKSAFERLRADEVHDLAEVYQELLQKKELAAFEVRERFYEIGSAQGMADLERYLKE